MIWVALLALLVFIGQVVLPALEAYMWSLYHINQIEKRMGKDEK